MGFRHPGTVTSGPHPGPAGGYRPDTYGESFAEVYDDWYGNLNDARAVARFVTARAGGGPVLELGVGTGRLALPLIEAGASVVGLDASSAMLARCQARTGAGTGVTLVQADMAHLPFAAPPAGVFGAVLVGFNTLFNLLSAADQGSLFRQAAAVLRADGVLVVEANQVEALASGPERWIGPVSADAADPSHRRLTVAATAIDHGAQAITGSHIDIDDRGVRVRPWRLRWSTIAEIDAFAAAAGLDLAERWADWDGAPFTPDGDQHVSVYRPAPGSGVERAGGKPPTAAS